MGIREEIWSGIFGKGVVLADNVDRTLNWIWDNATGWRNWTFTTEANSKSWAESIARGAPWPLGDVWNWLFTFTWDHSATYAFQAFRMAPDLAIAILDAHWRGDWGRYDTSVAILNAFVGLADWTRTIYDAGDTVYSAAVSFAGILVENGLWWVGWALGEANSSILGGNANVWQGIRWNYTTSQEALPAMAAQIGDSVRGLVLASLNQFSQDVSNAFTTVWGQVNQLGVDLGSLGDYVAKEVSPRLADVTVGLSNTLQQLDALNNTVKPIAANPPQWILSQIAIGFVDWLEDRLLERWE